MIRWDDMIESWEQLYDKFFVNRKYKDTSWKSEEEYMKAQQELAEKIDQLDKKATPEIAKIISEAYPEAELVVFDSRSNSKHDGIVGEVLLKGLESKTQTVEAQEWFRRKTAYKIRVDRFEDLPEDLREKLDTKREKRI